MTKAPSGFCQSLPNQPRVWDPTRLAIADTCWRKHYLATIRGLRRNGQPSVHLLWGTAYHACVEHYDASILEGYSLEQAKVEAIGCAEGFAEDEIWGETISTWHCTDPELVPAKRKKVWRNMADGTIEEQRQGLNSPGNNESVWELIPKMIQNRARCKYAKGWQPLPDDLAIAAYTRCECGQSVEQGSTFVPYDPKKTGETLIAAVKAYCESATSLKPYAFPDGTKALELQARLPLPITCPDREVTSHPDIVVNKPYELLVNIDQLVRWEEDIAIKERKTTGLQIQSPKVAWKYWAQFDPNIQIETYDLVGSVLYRNEDGRPPKIMVEALSIADPLAPYIERKIIHLSEARRAETFREIQSLILDAEKRAVDVAAGIDPEVAFPRRPTACVQGFRVCPFYDVCTASPGDREAIIQANYRVERWSPEDAESFTPEGESNEV